MISTALYRKLTNYNFLPLLLRLSQLCLFAGILWLCFINFMFSRSWFISENAFRDTLADFSHAANDSLILNFTHELKEVKESREYNPFTSGMEYMRAKTKEMGLETYVQEYPVYTGNGTKAKGYNIYTYLRARRSSQKDCLLIAYRHGLEQYNMSYHLAINNANINKVTRYGELATVLTLIHSFSNVNWLSRDIIFFGYDGDFQYGTAIRHFLKEYYEGADADFVRGGIIRQAMSLEFKSDDFNTYGLQLGKCRREHRGKQREAERHGRGHSGDRSLDQERKKLCAGRYGDVQRQ